MEVQGFFLRGMWIPLHASPVKHDVLGSPYVDVTVDMPRRLVEAGAEADYSRRVAFRALDLVVGMSD